MKYNYLKLAKMLKKEREEKGLSIRKLAEKVGISHTEISRIENGTRPQFSFVILAKICEELDIDLFNLIDDVGIWECDMDQLFYVMLKQEEEHIFKIHARCEYEAIRLVLDFVMENNLVDFSKSKKDLLMGAVKNPEDFNKEIIDNFDKTGKLYNSDEEDLREKVGIILEDDDDEIDEEDDEDESENEDEEIEINAVICPEDCIYYCPKCGNCTLED